MRTVECPRCHLRQFTSTTIEVFCINCWNERKVGVPMILVNEADPACQLGVDRGTIPPTPTPPGKEGV